MLKTVLNGVFGIVLAFGFIVILGAAGSADFGPVDPLENTIRAGIGVASMGVGFFGLVASGWKGIC